MTERKNGKTNRENVIYWVLSIMKIRGKLKFEQRLGRGRIVVHGFLYANILGCEFSLVDVLALKCKPAGKPTVERYKCHWSIQA